MTAPKEDPPRDEHEMRIAIAEQSADLDSPNDTVADRATYTVVVDTKTSNRIRVFAACAKKSIEAAVFEMIERGLGDALAEMEGRE